MLGQFVVVQIAAGGAAEHMGDAAGAMIATVKT